MFIMQQKKQLRWVKKNGYMVKTGSTSATPLSYMLASQLCVFDDRTDLKWKWVKQEQLQWTPGIWKWKLQTKIFLIVPIL